MKEEIQIAGVSKIFKLGLFQTKVAVEDLTLSVPKGKVIGLLGPNGSGKSTTLKMIMSFLRPTTGEISIFGMPSTDPRTRATIGYLPENPRFQKFLRGTEILSYYGHLLGLSGAELQKRIDYLLQLVGLSTAGKERVQGYSKGMTQRLALAQSLLNQPSLLIFDEPMSGLDPLGRMEIRKLISSIHEEMPSSTIFFSSHILEDIEQLCSFVALLRKGKLKTFCSIDELISNQEQRFDITVKGLSDEKVLEIQRKPKYRRTPIGFAYTINGTEELAQELEFLKQAGATVIGIGSHKRNLEEALFRGTETFNLEASA